MAKLARCAELFKGFNSVFSHFALTGSLFSGVLLMKNQLSAPRQRNSQGPRKSHSEQTTGHGAMKAGQRMSRTPRMAAIMESDGEPIATIGSVRSRRAQELDKTTLLAALLAFKGGDFSVRLP